MSTPSELKLGRVRLAELPGGDRTNGVAQVASGDVPQLGSAPVHADTTPPHHAG